MSKYCPDCGRELPDSAAFCDVCGYRLPDLNDAEPEETVSVNRAEASETYDTFPTCMEAAGQAIRRNPQEEWSHWDIPDLFSYSARKLRRFAEGEDKRLDGEPDRPVYVVSGSGALGQILPESEGEAAFFEWVFYTPEEGPDDLPQSLKEIAGHI